MNDITLSVVMITFNHQKYIEEAIHGILKQKCSFNFEFIIANDNSTDNTDSVITTLLEEIDIPKNIQIRYYCHDENKGMMNNFIWALKQAKGKYIATCEGDDYWIDCSKLQEQVNLLEKEQHLGLCFTDCELVNTENKVLNENLIPVKFQRELNQSDILSRFCPNTNTMLFRRELIIGINFENFKSVYNGDSFLFGFILQKFNAGYLPIKGGAYREHEGGVWSQKKQEFKLEKSIDSCLNIIKSYRVNEPQLFESYVDSRFRKLYALRKHIKAKKALTLLWKYMVFKWTFFKVKNSIFS